MVIRAVVMAAMVVLLAALSARAASRPESPRMLPATRTAPVVYVALGDSTVEGVAATNPRTTYVARLAERLRAVYPATSVENLGKAGAVSADVITAQLPQAIDLHPDLVTLSVGPNDITEGVAVADWQRNVTTIVRALRRETTAVVVVNLLPDLAVTPRFRHDERRAAVGRLTVRFNEVLARVARRYGIEIVDLYRASREEVPRRPELVASDGYHPSDLGYARWAELMWARVKLRIAREEREECPPE